MKASIVMATYNGERYLKEQLNSILVAMAPQDELLIADDGSNDDTMAILEDFADKDVRIHILPDRRHKGIQRNFSYAINKTSGDIIFLADQDDIWFKNKIQNIKNLFEDDNRLTCVLSDLVIVDGTGKETYPSFFKMRNVKRGFLNNLIRNSYIGNAMAFRASLKKIILPIPNHVPMHDQWIGMLSELYGKNYFLSEALGAYRRHDKNATGMKHGSLFSMIYKRIILLLNIIFRSYKLHQKHK